jgi:hypothetical protein
MPPQPVLMLLMELPQILESHLIGLLHPIPMIEPVKAHLGRAPQIHNVVHRAQLQGLFEALVVGFVQQVLRLVDEALPV